MKAKLPWILLGISLAFNVCFAVGFFLARPAPPKSLSTRAKAMAMAKKLELDESQMPAFERLLSDYEKLREDRSAERTAFLEELLKAEPDEQLLTEYMAGESRKKYNLAKLRLMREFIDLLSPTQREKFVQRIKERSSPAK